MSVFTFSNHLQSVGHGEKSKSRGSNDEMVIAVKTSAIENSLFIKYVWLLLVR